MLRLDTSITPWIYYSTAGALLGIAFVHPLLWILLVPGIVVWCYGLAEAKTLRQALLGGWLLGSVLFLFVLSWYWTVYPLGWLAIDSASITLAIIALYWVLTSIVLGLGALISSGMLWYVYARGITPTLFWLLVPAVVTLGYVAGSFLFSIYTLGPGSGLNSAFSFGYPGYLMLEHGVLRYVGMFGGVYTLTYIAVGIGVLIYICMRRVQGISALGVLLGCTLVLTATAGMQLELSADTPNASVRVVAIGSDIPLEEYTPPSRQAWRQAQLWDVLASMRSLNPDYVVLPEGALMTHGMVAEEVFTRLSGIGMGERVLVDSVSAVAPSGAVVGRTVVYDPRVQQVYHVDKRYLVPQGEYVPYVYDFLFWLFGQNDFFGARTARMSYERGAEDTESRAGHIPGILSCFEGVWPTSVARLIDQGETPFIAHPISHNWFNAPQGLWYQLQQMTALQALANRVPIVQAGNRGPTVAYDRFGKLQQSTAVISIDGYQAYVFDIPVR